ncbi:MAG: glutamine synthetase, partial [Pseudomonadota bacterium]|nr:glutamine synthetase [Pseudomonadota bacterium]
MIDGYIELKQEEIQKINNIPHPAEFELYYSV